MRSYRIWELGNPASLQIDEIADLQPQANEIVVAVEAAAVGYVDTLVIAGRYQNTPPVPFAAGMEFAGRVLAIGADISGVVAGDRVVAYAPNGAFAEQSIARSGEFFTVPDDMSSDQAVVLCGAYLTAHFALVERGKFKAGESVLVGGGGGAVGLAAIQIARALGAGRIFGTYRSMSDRQAILNAGADEAVDISNGDMRETLKKLTANATGGAGIDVVLDPLGSDFFQAAIRTLGWGGRHVVIGFVAGEIPTVKVNYLLLKNISVVGVDTGQNIKRDTELGRKVQSQLFRLWREGRLVPRVAHCFAFKDIPQALQLVASGRTGGRVTIDFSGDEA